MKDGNSRTTGLGRSNDEQESFTKARNDSYGKGESPHSRDNQNSIGKQPKKASSSKDNNVFGGSQFSQMNQGFGSMKLQNKSNQGVKITHC